MVSAVVLGNALTALYMLAVAKGNKSEAEHGDLRGLPTWLLFCGMIAPLGLAVTMFFTIT